MQATKHTLRGEGGEEQVGVALWAVGQLNGIIKRATVSRTHAYVRIYGQCWVDVLPYNHTIIFLYKRRQH